AGGDGRGSRDDRRERARRGNARPGKRARRAGGRATARREALLQRRLNALQAVSATALAALPGRDVGLALTGGRAVAACAGRGCVAARHVAVGLSVPPDGTEVVTESA